MTNMEYYQHETDEVRKIVQQDEMRVPFLEWLLKIFRWWSFEELVEGFTQLEFKNKIELLLWAIIATFVIIMLRCLNSRRSAKKRIKLQKKKK